MQSPPTPPDNSPDPQWTILKILQWTTSYFNNHPVDSPRLTAEILLAHVLGINRIDLYLRFDQPLTKQELAEFKRFIKRRVAREPVAYIIGTREFWGIDYRVTPDVLIPRPETEFLVETGLKLIPEDADTPFRTIDVGTGSGAVIVALAVNRPGHEFFASDISEKAIRVAAENASRNRVDNAIYFFSGELFCPLRSIEPTFDLIVSNPPYIPSHDISELEPEVRANEPLLALDGGADGLDIVRTIIREAPAYLKKNGTLLLEIGYDQKTGVSQLVENDGRYSDLTFIRDYSGHDRVAQIRL